MNLDSDSIIVTHWDLANPKCFSEYWSSVYSGVLSSGFIYTYIAGTLIVKRLTCAQEIFFQLSKGTKIDLEYNRILVHLEQSYVAVK